MKQYLARALVGSLMLLLTACPAVDTGNPNPEPTQMITQVGSVLLNDLTDPVYGGYTNAAASFNSITEIQADELPKNPLEPYLDTCFVTQNPDETPPFLDFVPGDIGPTTALDAGEMVTVRVAGEVFSRLERSGQGGGIFYLEDNAETPSELPDEGLTVSIPGATFPAYVGASFPAAPKITVSQPTDITPQTAFSWQNDAPANTNSAVLLAAVQISETSPDAFVGVSCVATDDGSFSFPAATQSELGDAGFESGVLLEVSRFASKLEFSGNSALYLQVFRQTGFGAGGF